MRPPPPGSGAWFCSVILVLAALCLQIPIAAGEQLPLPLQPHLTPDMRLRLAEAALDSSLAPWQREFMLGVARHGAEGTTTQQPPAPPSVVLLSDGIAADDGSWIALAPGESPPAGRSEPTAIYDPVRDRMVVFGGTSSSESPPGRSWTSSMPRVAGPGVSPMGV